MARDFHLLDVARAVTDEIHQLLGDTRSPLLHRFQIEKSAESIVGNIAEAYGRRKGPERNQYLRVARGEAGETKAHLRTNQVAKRLHDAQFWRLYNRLEVIRKMICRIIGE